jgi:hypothetical protein
MGAEQSTASLKKLAADAYDTFDKKIRWQRIELFNRLAKYAKGLGQPNFLEVTIINHPDILFDKITDWDKYDETEKKAFYKACIEAIEDINSGKYTQENIDTIIKAYQTHRNEIINSLRRSSGGRRKSKSSRKNRRKTTKRR